MDDEIEVTMPWPKICQMAVRALCLGVTMNDLCVAALDSYLQRKA